MNARHQEDYQYPNKKPARYTNNKTNAYFNKSGITQLGYIRWQLENLQNEDTTSHNTKICITQIISLIDGLADKSRGSSISVNIRLKTFGEDLMRIFPAKNGAIVFEDIALLEAAKIITRGIAAIQPGDLDPPKPLLVAMGKNNAEVCDKIKSTMTTINAQIDFLIQLQENAQASETLHQHQQETLKIAASLEYIQYIDNQLIDHKIQDSPGQTNAKNVLKQVETALEIALTCLDEYIRSECSAMTLETRDADPLSPLKTLELILKNPAANLINNKKIKPVFMVTHIPMQLARLSKSINNILDWVSADLDITSANNNTPHLKEMLDNYKTQSANLAQNIKAAIMAKGGEPKLTTLLSDFHMNTQASFNEYKRKALGKGKNKNNNTKLAICCDLSSNIHSVKTDDTVKPDVEFFNIISLVTSAFYKHNDFCSGNKKSPGTLGKILDKAMSDLANISKNLCAKDGADYEHTLQKLDNLLDIKMQNNTPRNGW